MKRFTPLFIAIRNNLFALLLFVLLWGGSSLFFPPYVIPSPLAVFRDTASYLDAEFWRHLNLTLSRVIAGFLLAFVIGTVCGMCAIGVNRSQYLNTLMVLFQVIPGTILGVILLLVFGLGSRVPIALVAFLTLPTMAINTSSGLARKNALLEQYLQSIGGTSAQRARYIYLPLLIPTLRSNLTIGFSLSLKVVILGEFIGSQDGIGYLFNLAKIYFHMDDVFFYLFIILLIMVCFQILLHGMFTLFLGKYFYPD